MSDENSLFPNFENEWQKEWKDMPEYNNPKPLKAKLQATFQFKTDEDFNIFMEVIKRELYNNKRVFDGNQTKNHKTAWFPLPPRPSENIYIDDNN